MSEYFKLLIKFSSSKCEFDNVTLPSTLGEQKQSR